MARKPRVQYPGAVYHVMSRGNQGQTIFRGDQDREEFVKTLGEACDKTGWWVHAYVLMGNHYHLLLETPEANLVAGMKWLQGTYTRRFNLRHRVCGHVLAGRYKAIVVDESEESYFGIVSTYIHLNPVRAGLVRPGEQRLRGYRWSSYLGYIGAQLAPPWLRTDRVLGALGFGGGQRAERRGYEAYLESRALECGDEAKARELQAEWRSLRRGWYVGDKTFADRVIEAVGRGLEGRRKASLSGEAVDAHGEEAAERRLAAATRALRWEGRDWQARPKVTIEKQILAWWLRSQTSASCRWISERLGMGDESSVSRAVGVIREAKERQVRRWQRVLRRLPVWEVQSPASGETA